MGFKKKFLGAGLVTVMSLGFATGAFAATEQTDDVELNVKAGDFKIETSAIQDFGDITLDSSKKDYKTSFEGDVKVTDLRGAFDGWNVSVEASQFNSGSATLPTGSLTLDSPSNIEQIGNNGNIGKKLNADFSGNTIIDDGGVSILITTGAEGAGVNKIEFPSDALTINVDPSTAKAGTYTSTLTWNLTQAP